MPATTTNQYSIARAAYENDARLAVVLGQLPDPTESGRRPPEQG